MLMMYYTNKGSNICYITDHRNEMEDKDRERDRENTCTMLDIIIEKHAHDKTNKICKIQYF